ncbi:LTA synthase family protein [Bordetella hinzii]|uniref:LTA synthase family protein n=1 Tax=Bordetella hinzii TaxID=103855 RepID=UPI0039FBE3DC
MLEAFWIPLLPPFFLGLLLSWAVECLLLPRPAAPWRRPWAANFTHLGVWLIAFALELALFRRPYFAVANVLTIQLVIILVSRAKYQALQEPFVYPDFEYFTDAIKHPRLYLPFFEWRNALAAGGGYGLALWAGISLEAPIALPSFYPYTAAITLCGAAVSIVAGRRLEVEFDADRDLTRMGLTGALWAYGQAERQPIDMKFCSTFAKDPDSPLPSQTLPDLVSVQSESFFDARRIYPIIKRDVLRGFDQLCAEAVIHGELEVTARGANTVRTEFAFLSGINAVDMGVHKYNPYRHLARHAVPTIASYLKRRGYRTVCVHPYHGSFYRRNRVLPALGFDEFIDISEFQSAKTAGSYVADEALGEYVLGRLKRELSQPVFIHVITMENHGPLHMEEIPDGEADGVLNGDLPADCRDLVAYARHLRNGSAMLERLRRGLNERARPSVLCVFGDHIPIMPRVYCKLGQPEGRTDYVIWKSGLPTLGKSARVSVQDLAGLCLQAMGLDVRTHCSPRASSLNETCVGMTGAGRNYGV